jgi:DNA-binding IclR family transcriptional regulator
MLLEVRRFLAQAGPLTPQEVAGHLDVEPSVAEGMLEVLVRRGEATRQPLSAYCTSCAGSCSGGCGIQNMTLYAAKTA